ncbi:ligand-binding sensor domain-containing diguanylate cyclase [Butyrivibrio sp. AE3004]|uniref:ligand-binding sensor domain-containing diguanylate cyclase n=1 Tax=Butyrivibrio sp. AE3004 TaxID=1506994 RepID=UPI0018CC2174|nr:ligand-binding sensor domain-containing diguanylate cyclase [Butyrivibrio sp. AE3004]
MKKWQTCLLIAVCVFINLIGRSFAEHFQLPFWLDSIGTIITAIELGPVGGAVCGAFSNILLGIITVNIKTLAYLIVSVCIGVSVGLFYPKASTQTAFKVASTAVLTGIVAVAVSTPMNLYLYGGRTGNIWGDGLIDMIARDVNVPVLCTCLGEAFVDIPDKALSVLLASGMIKLYYIFIDRRKKSTADSALLWLLVPVIVMTSMTFSINAKAIDMSSEYAATTYDTDDGLATVEINAIAQTNDGYIWAGTYAGLYLCDGYRFEEIVLDERISSVMVLYVDSEGMLWIGTNDSGLACFNPTDRTIRFITEEDGLPSDSIRAICEDTDGYMYVGTATALCMFGKDGKIQTFDDDGIKVVTSLTCNSKDVVAGVTMAGELFIIKNHEYVDKIGLDDENTKFGAVAAGERDEFYAGSTSNYVIQVNVSDDKIELGKKYTIGHSEYFNKLYYSPQNNGFFCGLENSCGFLTKEGKFTEMTTDSFNGAVKDIMVDYQGNVWFASNKQGIVRYSWNPFTDIFARAGVNPEVVNCTLIKDGMLYVGTNNGLVTIDLKTFYAVPIDFPELFKDVRIRYLMEDSKGNLWVSTYGKHGLIEIKADGTIDTYNERNKNTNGSRFRLTMELEDGTIIAASTTGINFINGGVVTGTMGEKEGLTTQVLSMVDIGHGYVELGTDGEGIMIIKDGEIIHQYGKDDGMGSLVIMKIVPCGDNEYLYVTSNALYHYKDEKVTKLTNFPYNNNYDVFFTEDGYAWISSSAGIFIVKKSDLLENGEYNYMLLNKGRGLYSALTANSENSYYNGSLYLCCADGVRRIAIADENVVDTDYTITISKLTANNEIIEPDENGNYVIPAISGRITFDVAALNFTLSDPLLHIFLEGTGDDGITCKQKEMKSLSYINLPYGDYTLRVQVYDSAGKDIVREEKFHITKESQIFERTYFKAYLIFVCTLFVMFIGWLIGNIRMGITNMEKLEKEARIDPMTGFWNKGYTQLALEEICKESKGILMMIDLDNFKLVNDVFGHETGDKVLAKFAELVRSCVREDDFVGRIGGDEFVAFIQGTSEEGAVAEKERFLNEEILKSGEEIMGQDMGIPLGVSIGAVATTDEGDEYANLFRKADKALYSVKQNGKHGYFMYKNSSINAGEEVQAAGVAGIKMVLEERGIQKGAYFVDFDKLQMAYRLFSRMAKRTIVNIWLVQFVMTRDDGEDVDDKVMERFVEVLTASLRSNDVMAMNGKNKVILILTVIDAENGHTPIERIINQWNSLEGHEGYSLTYETEGM